MPTIGSAARYISDILNCCWTPSVESGVSVENVTRELVTDDAGNPVLRFFNPLLGRVIYLTR